MITKYLWSSVIHNILSRELNVPNIHEVELEDYEEWKDRNFLTLEENLPGLRRESLDEVFGGHCQNINDIANVVQAAGLNLSEIMEEAEKQFQFVTSERFKNLMDEIFKKENKL
jgi:hypothetical protein